MAFEELTSLDYDMYINVLGVDIFLKFYFTETKIQYFGWLRWYIRIQMISYFIEVNINY